MPTASSARSSLSDSSSSPDPRSALAQAFEWHLSHERRMSPHTVRNYAAAIAFLRDWCVANGVATGHPSELQPAALRRFLIAHGRDRTRRTLHNHFSGFAPFTVICVCWARSLQIPPLDSVCPNLKNRCHDSCRKRKLSGCYRLRRSCVRMAKSVVSLRSAIHWQWSFYMVAACESASCVT